MAVESRAQQRARASPHQSPVQARSPISNHGEIHSHYATSALSSRCRTALVLLPMLAASSSAAATGPAVNVASGIVQLARSSVSALEPNVEGQISGLRKGRKIGVTRLAARPYVYLLRGFLTTEECDHLISRAEQHGFEVAETEGSAEVSTAWRRACDVTYLSASDDPILLEISQCAAGFLFAKGAWSRKDELGSQTEALHVLRYSSGGEYKVHWDACWQEPRVATVLYYLNGIGETWFPLACSDLQAAASMRPETQRAAYERAFRSDPARDGLRVQPGRGDALVFYNFDENADLDIHALHAGLPAPSTKLIASQFFKAERVLPLRETGWWARDKVNVPDHVLSSSAR